jgi:F0F1-type ATP synthase assembly protein I
MGIHRVKTLWMLPQDSRSKARRRQLGASGVAAWAEAERLMQIALLLPSAVFVGWLVGAWLDLRLHQSWITAAGMIFGGISGMIYVIRMVLDMGKRMDAREKTTKNEEKPPAEHE